MNKNIKREFEIEKDKCQLLNIFPEEIWEIVLTSLINPEDLTRISNSSMFFRNRLLSQRTMFLFPEVWNILGKAYESSDSLAYTERTTLLTKFGGGDFMWFTVILKLRLVSRFWKHVIDNFYQHFEDIYSMFQDPRTPNDVYKEDLFKGYTQDASWTRAYVLTYLDEISEFREHFGATHAKKKSPFIANAVTIQLKEDFSEEFMQELKMFLEEYGQFVWHCEIELNHSFPLLNGIYSMLHSICTLVPNLLTLTINYIHKTATGRYKYEYSLNELEILQRDVESLPMPTWKNLKLLKTYMLPVPILNELVDKNRDVEMMEVTGNSAQQTHGVYLKELSNLAQLSLQIFAKTDLEALQLTNWKLEKIYLDFSKGGYISWSEILQLLENKWSETATNVMLNLPKAVTKEETNRHYGEFGSLRLHLSKLKRLRLVLPSLSLIDFVLPMRQTLEQTEIVMPGSSKSDKEYLWNGAELDERIKYNKTIELFDLNNFYDSNIWELFPKLQSLHLSSSPDYYIGRNINCTRTKWTLRAKNYL